ncbi:unnamed protein product (mitochondrion) [Plasmodiophora brassicae]|uniref:Uncharacterized protein n=1 Tax=Plasmodiophora brassicae TaxID=37360 RepID=A0A3P3Y216_PLABS|nr:unnamed protein product [Plasmodiophora brassicae]
MKSGRRANERLQHRRHVASVVEQLPAGFRQCLRSDNRDGRGRLQAPLGVHVLKPAHNRHGRHHVTLIMPHAHPDPTPAPTTSLPFPPPPHALMPNRAHPRTPPYRRQVHAANRRNSVGASAHAPRDVSPEGDVVPRAPNSLHCRIGAAAGADGRSQTASEVGVMDDENTAPCDLDGVDYVLVGAAAPPSVVVTGQQGKRGSCRTRWARTRAWFCAALGDDFPGGPIPFAAVACAAVVGALMLVGSTLLVDAYRDRQYAT